MRFLFFPLFLFLLWIPFSAGMDMKLASFFYGVDGFTFTKTSHDLLFSWLIKYGNIPGHILAAGAAGLWLFTFYRPSWQRVRLAAFTVTLVACFAIIGILAVKEVYGRPRPHEVMQFGGNERFRAFYSPTWQVPNDNYKSFPSGHVGVGTLFITLGLVGWQERWYSIALFGFLVGLPFAFLLGYVRMAQGAHFLSDVLAAGVGIWILSVLVISILYSGDASKAGVKTGVKAGGRGGKKAR